MLDCGRYSNGQSTLHSHFHQIFIPRKLGALIYLEVLYTLEKPFIELTTLDASFCVNLREIPELLSSVESRSKLQTNTLGERNSIHQLNQ
ncbi:hypothetical protein JHK85_010166 [Glycine max]|nr:hypothetical protein JHK85_010166 [Glycine max]